MIILPTTVLATVQAAGVVATHFNSGTVPDRFRIVTVYSDPTKVAVTNSLRATVTESIAPVKSPSTTLPVDIVVAVVLNGISLAICGAL